MRELSVTQYAKEKGITRAAAYLRIKAGTVKYKKIGNIIIILEEDHETTNDKRNG
jgi:hypothetical protein